MIRWLGGGLHVCTFCTIDSVEAAPTEGAAESKQASQRFLSEVSSRPLEPIDLSTNQAISANTTDSVRVLLTAPIMSSETKYEEVRLVQSMNALWICL